MKVPALILGLVANASAYTIILYSDHGFTGDQNAYVRLVGRVWQS